MFSCYSSVDCILTDNDYYHISSTICRAIAPRLIGFFDDGLGDVSPVVLMGYLGTQPVYRVTNTFATEREGLGAGQLEVHWPALFPNVIIPICQSLQLDVTFRNCDQFQSPSPVESDDNDDDSEGKSEDADKDEESDYRKQSKHMLMWMFELDNIRWWE